MIKLTWQAQPRHFVSLLCIQCIQGLVPLATAWVTKVLFDLLALSLQGHVYLQDVFILLVFQVTLSVCNQILSPMSQYLKQELGRNLSLTIKTNVYQKLNSLSGLACFEDPRFHDTIQVVANGAQFTPQQALAAFISLIQGVITVSAFLGVLLAFSPLLAAIVGIATLPQVYAQLKFGHQRFRIAFGNSPKERHAAYYGQVLSWVQYAKEVRLFNLGDYFLKHFVQTTQEIYQTQRSQQKREMRWQGGLSVLTSLVAAGAFIVVVLQAFAGKLSIGDVSLYTSAVVSVQSTLIGIVFGLSQLNENALFFRQYTDLLDLPEQIQMSRSPHPVPTLTRGITLRHVSFRYSEQHPWVLRHVDLFLPAGECLALVGLNGAGKTTLVKLLTRMYDPTEGEILWDGIDLREFDPTALRQHIGTIFQDFAHYDLSVQHNIGLGEIAEMENLPAVQQAATRAGVHQRILALSEGYQSVLSRWLAKKEAVGVDLSGGEWQKIALARMFMRHADMLMLDEPTAALDAQAEYELYLHFRELMRGRTCLLIAHRFSTVRMADHIAVLEHGSIIEYGQHEELGEQEGTYARLYEMQAASYK
ncbi:MAG: ABC transporter ATP-binding protein [Chloroflexota bacterium]